jgi:hypothetical protein
VRDPSVTHRLRSLTGLLALAIGLSMSLAAAPAATAAPHRVTRAPTLAETTGLTVTIDSINPAVLIRGDGLELSGVVRNDADHIWTDAQVYLEMSEQPATTKGELDDFALTGDTKFGDRVIAIGLFDQIGAIPSGQAVGYHLSIPYGRLPIAGGPGVYHIAVSVLASSRGARDEDADARTTALLPLEDPAQPIPQQTDVTTLIPVTAPVPRQSADVFAGDRLASDIADGGRLRNVLNFALAAPTDSLDLVVDPSVLSALRAMSDGYEVIRLSEGPNPTPTEGEGAAAAAAWLEDFQTVQGIQNIDYLPWGNTNTSGLASLGMRGVADAAFGASIHFATDEGFNAPVVDWQNNGASTRRGLSVAGRSGAALHVVSQDTLTKLQLVDGYPPALASVRTRNLPVTTTVSRSDVAGEPFTAATTALELRQALLSEAMVRALSATAGPVSVVAAPFRWNPGFVSSNLALDSAYGSNLINPLSLSSLNLPPTVPTEYRGPVEVTIARPDVSSGLDSAIRRLRDAGRVYTTLLTDGRDATTAFDQQLAAAGSSAWLWQPKRGEALTRRTARSMDAQIDKVTVTGPEFVALSSEAGRFPLTVSNGLDLSVTVNVSVVPRNPALQIKPIDPIVLDPGQNRVIEVETKAEGSGVTSVRARLATSDHREFGAPWEFDIRATRIGLAIWILLGVLIAALFSGAAIRIVRRVRGGGFRPRGQQPA